ncbi:MAG: alpha/beta hydrolase family protein [Bifidobacteriaceae bacterium]|jgi:hypothetical protein|nr:alpha/beta hydrolase family protein [Bifidobacteriaceae bacterium]
MFRLHLASRAATGVALVVTLASGPFAYLAVERAAAVAAGPTEAPTAVYDLTSSPSLLAPTSDDALRVTAIGHLEGATRIAVLVPGVAVRFAEFDEDGTRSLQAHARALFEAMGGTSGERVAVVAWLGYVTPANTVEALGAGPMREGAANLAAFQHELDRTRPEAHVTWVCHSYGSLVCASALVQADPDTVVIVGSPGMMVGNAGDLATTARIFALRGGVDPIRLSAALDLFGGGFGADPASTGFGAELLATGPGTGHSDYFRRGSTQLAEIAAAVLADAGPPAGRTRGRPAGQAVVARPAGLGLHDLRGAR